MALGQEQFEDGRNDKMLTPQLTMLAFQGYRTEKVRLIYMIIVRHRRWQ